MTEKNKSEKERLDSLFDNLSPELGKKVAAKMIIAAKIDDARKRLNLNRVELAKKLRKNPSEMTKWLSGNHNFTVDTLIEVEGKLGIKLLSLDEAQDLKMVYFPKEQAKYLAVTQAYFRFDDYSKSRIVMISSKSIFLERPQKLDNFIRYDGK